MNDWLLLLLKSVYFLVPAYLANMAPPLVKKLKWVEFLNVPVDMGKNFLDKKPLFGRNKTYRGFVVGIIGGIIGAYLQMALLNITFFRSITLDVSLYQTHWLIISLGVLMGLGAIMGDLIESFVKRRLNVGPGESFVPWDQTDLVMGAYFFVLPIMYMHLSWVLFLSSIVVTFFLHIIVNHIAFYLDIRKERW